MDTKEVQSALAASPAARVTEERVNGVIVSETFVHRVVGTLTICVLSLANGFTVVGKSACASPENYRDDLGEHYAREDAKRQIWTLEAYLLREDLSVAAKFASAPKEPGMKLYVGKKAVYAKSMTVGEYRKGNFGGAPMTTRDDPEQAGYMVQYSDGYISWSPVPAFVNAYRTI